MADRQPAKQRLVQQSEDRGVGADAQRQSDYGNGGEDRRFANLT